jgi:hypothetical protein
LLLVLNYTIDERLRQCRRRSNLVLLLNLRCVFPAASNTLIVLLLKLKAEVILEAVVLEHDVNLCHGFICSLVSQLEAVDDLLFLRVHNIVVVSILVDVGCPDRQLIISSVE